MLKVDIKDKIYVKCAKEEVFCCILPFVVYLSAVRVSVFVASNCR